MKNLMLVAMLSMVCSSAVFAEDVLPAVADESTEVRSAVEGEEEAPAVPAAE